MKWRSLFNGLLVCSLCCAYAQAESAATILSKTGTQGGIVVCVGADDPEFLIGLAPAKRYLVHCLDTDGSKVSKARRYIQSKGIYGQVSVDRFNGETLPYANNLVNLVILRSIRVPEAEVNRVLCPLGTAYENGRKKIKPWPKEIDEWGHFLHGPDNNPVVNDSVVGLPRNLQWVSGPTWARSHEELSTISAAVTSGGRVFYIVDQAPQAFISFETEWKLVARDAFNGVLLWERSIPKWNDHMRHFRSGPVHLQRRLVAAADKVYVTLGLDAPLSQLDAATGQTLRTYEDTEWCEEVITDNGILYVLVGSSETKRRGPGLYAKDEPAMREDRYMAAIDASTGKEIWRMNAKGAEYILPHGMALSNGRLYYHSVKGLGRLDAKTGKKLWLIERETLAARYGYSTSKLVATPEVILLADSNLKKEGRRAVDDIEWGVGAWSAPGLRGGPSTVTAYSASDGKRLWSANCHGGYNAPIDVFVVDGVVWLGPYNTKETSKDGYDLKTGKVVKTISIKGDKVGMVHDRCYLNKASNNFVFGCRDGVELHDFEKGWVRNNSWTRGPCQLGVMPANGLLYAPTDPCACHLKTRLPGFKAYSSNRLNSVGKPLSTEGRLTRGPAYGKLKALPAQKTSAMDWPIHRNDIARSGSTPSSISTPVRTKWTKKVGGKLTQPVIADGRVLVAAPDRQTIYAFDEATGESLWTFLAGGVIDSSPSLHQGRVLFGAADGKVYCLDAQTGAIAWTFLAAPQEWLICAFGRLTSAWPVHGSLITVGNEVCFTAGKSSYLSGGLHFYRLDIPTGKVMAHNIYTTIDPKTEKQIGEEDDFDGPGIVSDILSSDGASLFMKHLQFNMDGKETTANKAHLFSPTSLLDEEWFVRSYWAYTDTIMSAGYGGWVASGKAGAWGRVISFDDKQIFGYGRANIKGGKVGHRLNVYRLFCVDKSVAAERTAKSLKIFHEDKVNARRELSRTSPPQRKWSLDFPLTVRAMVATSDRLVVAGVPFVAKRNSEEGISKSGRLEFTNPEEALKAFRGERGAFIHVVSGKDGSKISKHKLPAPPVHDGMSVANGKIFISLKNGAVLCLAGQ